MRFRHLLLLVPLLGACSRDHRTDLEKLTDFHRQLVAVDHRVAAASSAYTRASNAALNSGNHAALFSAATTFRLSMMAIDTRSISVPDFKNKDAGTDAGQALDALTAQISALQDAAAALEGANDPKQPAPSDLVVAAQAQDQANSDAVEETSEIVQAYGDLGIAPDRVDTANGGLRKK